MRVYTPIALTMAGLIFSAPATAQDNMAESQASRSAPANQYICSLKASVPASAVRQEAAKAAGPELGQILFTYSHAVKGFTVRLPAAVGRSGSAALQKHNPNIRFCIPDGITRALAAG